MKTTNIIQRLSLLLFALMPVATAGAQSVTLQEGVDGTKYADMSATGTNTLTLADAGVTSFKVYDDGGKDGDYSDNCDGTLVLTAPEGYVIRLSGSINTEASDDNLTVYDGSDNSAATLLNAASSAYDGSQTDIPSVLSSGRSMTLRFTSDGSGRFAGLDLQVEVVRPGPFPIGSAADWEAFRNRVNGGETGLDAKLTQDIDLGTLALSSDMAGVENAYSGTLYGEGHTLTYTLTGEAKALFFTMKTAFIKDLKVKATCADAREVAALVYYCTDAYNTFDRVHCDIAFSSQQPLANAAGMIQKVTANCTVNITNCAVSGTFSATGLTAQRQWFGFVRNSRGLVRFDKCLYAGTNDADGNLGGTFCGGSNGTYTLTDCYYQSACGYAQGEGMTEEQMKSGYAAQMLREKASGVWGQNLKTDLHPYPTTNKNLRVYQAEYYWGTELKATRYANYKQHPTEPIVKNVKGSDYIPQHYYEPVYSSGYTAEGGITQDCQATFTDKGTFVISTLADWNKFSDIMRGGQTQIGVQLANDIDLGTITQADIDNLAVKQVGTYANSYAGVFDGQGHTISYVTDVNSFAPFRYLGGGTLQNFRVAGRQNAAYCSAGVVNECRLTGNVIKNVESAVNMHAKLFAEDRGAECSGMIRYIYSGSDLLIEDCKVSGVFEGKSQKSKLGWSGFVFKNIGNVTLRNCLYAGTNNVLEGAANSTNDRGMTFAQELRSTLDNCHYLHPCGAPQGTQATEAQMSSGEIAIKLQAGRTDFVWGQTLGTDNFPMLTAQAEKQVYAVDFTVNNEVKATRYANAGQTVVPPTYEEVSDPELHYAFLGYGNGYTAETPITSHLTVPVRLDSYFLIDSREKWIQFADRVNAGQATLRAKLTADIDIKKDPTSIGIAFERAFSGMFHGNGHTVTVEFATAQKSLFHSIRNAKIEDLNVIALSHNAYFNSGLVQNSYGNNEINRCNVNVNFTCSHSVDNRAANTAGMVSCVRDGHLIINDCLVKGQFHGSTTWHSRQAWAGFVKDNEATTTLNNCFLDVLNNVPENNAYAGHTFGSGLQLNNCYYTTPCGIAQGIAVTAAQQQSGEVARHLQNGRTEAAVWTAIIGAERATNLYRAADRPTENYVYFDTENNTWACDNFRLTYSAMPIGLDFVAKKLSNDRKLTRAGNHTICLPYELTLPENVKAYTLSRVDEDEQAARFAEVSDGILEANKPYLLVASGNASLDSAIPTAVKGISDKQLELASGDHTFVGTLDRVDNAAAAASNAYILQSDGLWHRVTNATPAAYIPAYRAYITAATAGAKALSFTIDGETTGVGTTAEEGPDNPVRYYDLLGRSLGITLDGRPKGVYIGNGKKVMNP